MKFQTGNLPGTPFFVENLKPIGKKRQGGCIKYKFVDMHTHFLYFSTLKFKCSRIVGWGCQVGQWSRVEGSPTELDPNRPHATTDNFYLFDDEGKLLPSKTFLLIDMQ